VSRFAEPVFIAAGLRTPFGRGGGALANYDAASLSVPVVQEMAKLAEPDLSIWGTVIPNLGWSNIAREIWLDAKLNPNVPAFSVVLACSTSMTASFAAAGMLGGGLNLILVGGSEVMSRPSLALTAEASKRRTCRPGGVDPSRLCAPHEGLGQPPYGQDDGRSHGGDRQGVAHLA